MPAGVTFYTLPRHSIKRRTCRLQSREGPGEVCGAFHSETSQREEAKEHSGRLSLCTRIGRLAVTGRTLSLRRREVEGRTFDLIPKQS